MSIVVRPADLETDALAIVDGAKNFIARMDFTAFLPDDEYMLVEAIGRVLEMDGTRVLVADQDGAIVGGIGWFQSAHLWNPNIVAAEELFWWAHPDAPATTALALLRGALAAMREGGVNVASFKALQSSPARVHDVYQRLGLEPVETNYVGVL